MLSLLFLFVSFAFCRVQSECIPQVFILPLFHDLKACQTNTYDFKCDQLFVDFVGGCAESTLKPQKISVLFSPFDVPLACKMSTTECEGMAEKTGQLAILPHSSTDLLKSFAHFQLPTTRMCLDNAVAVILTDIPCSSYKDYPDVNGLLGDDRLLETIKTFNTEFKLHTVIAYLSPNASYPKTEACTNLKQHKFDPRADFLEFEFLNYEQLDGKICDKPILYPRNNTLPVPPRLGTPWIEIMVIAGIVFVGVVVLCCGAGLVYCFCKECKKRRNLS